MASSPRLASTDDVAVRLDRLERLQRVTAALSAAATPDEVAAAIFEHGVGASGARGGNLLLVDEAGELCVVRTFGLPAELAARLPEMMKEGRLPATEAFDTGEPVWVESREALLAHYPTHRDCLDALGDGAMAGLPIGLGAPRGALSLRWGEAHAFDEGEREFLVALSRQASQALERARLFEDQQAQGARIAALQEVTAALSAALTPREVAAVVFRGLLRLGPRNGGLFRRTDDGHLDLVFSQGSDQETQGLLAHVPLDRPTPPTDAARRGEPVWLESVAAIEAAYPHLTAHRLRRGDGAWVALPLVAEGRSFGALAFTLREGRRLGAEDKALAVALAQQAAQALERARLFDAQHRLARRLASLHAEVAALSGAVSAAELATAILGALEVLGAFGVELWALEGDEVRRAAVEGDVCGAGPHGDVVHVDAPNPVAEVARVGRAVWAESPEAFRDRWPHLDHARAEAGIAACALLPLLAAGRTLGVLVVGWDEPRALPPEDRAHLRLVAMPGAYALERALWRDPAGAPERAAGSLTAPAPA